MSRVRRRAESLRNEMVVTFGPHLTESEVCDWCTDPRTWVQRRPAVCAWRNANVLPNGDVESCPGVVCGNVAKQKFPQIWNGPQYRAFRRRLAHAGDLPICARCCAYFRRD